LEGEVILLDVPGVKTPGLQFGHLQDFFRVNKSLLSTKAERDLGSWPKVLARTRPGGTPEYRRAINPVYWLQALLELAIIARSKIEDDDEDDWSIA
jgi:hypothetical protein